MPLPFVDNKRLLVILGVRPVESRGQTLEWTGERRPLEVAGYLWGQVRHSSIIMWHVF